MEAQAQAAAQAAALPPQLHNLPSAPSVAPPMAAAPYLPAPQFTFQPHQRNPPLYFDSRTASFRPDAAPGSGASGIGDSAASSAAFRFSASIPVPTATAASTAALAPELRAADGGQGLSVNQPQGIALGASAVLHAALPKPMPAVPAAAVLASEYQPPSAEADAPGASQGLAPDPMPRPQSRGLAASLQAAAAARKQGLAAPPSVAAAATPQQAVGVGPREASTVIITEVSPSPEKPRSMQPSTAAPVAKQSNQAADSANAPGGDASAHAEQASHKRKAGAPSGSEKPPAKLSSTHQAAAGGSTIQPDDANFTHLPPHLRPQYAAAAQKATASQTEPAALPAPAAPSSAASGSASTAPVVRGVETARASSVEMHRKCCELLAVRGIAVQSLLNSHMQLTARLRLFMFHRCREWSSRGRTGSSSGQCGRGPSRCAAGS